MSASDRERLANSLRDLEQTRIKNEDELMRLQEEHRLKTREYKQWWKEEKQADRVRRKELKRNKKQEKLQAKANKQDIKNKKNAVAETKAEINAIIKSDKALQAASAAVAKNEISQLREEQRQAELRKQQEEKKKSLQSKSAEAASLQKPPPPPTAEQPSDGGAKVEDPLSEKRLTSQGSKSLKSPEVKKVDVENTPGIVEPPTPEGMKTKGTPQAMPSPAELSNGTTPIAPSADNEKPSLEAMTPNTAGASGKKALVTVVSS